MSVIHNISALPGQTLNTVTPSQTLPGWHGLVAMTRPASPSVQLSAMWRSLARPVVRPLRWMIRSLMGRQINQDIAALRAGQVDLAIALQELVAWRAAETAPRFSRSLSGRRLVWISSWQTRCGIAEYSRQLLEAFQATNLGWNITVLHDARPTLPQISSPLGISARPGFALGGANTIARLALGIAAERADCVVIQHHAALIPWPELADLLLHPAVSARCVVVVLHNTQDILILPHWLRQKLYAALRSVDRVMVHTPRDMALLQAFGLDNLQRLPHGCAKIAIAAPARDLPPQAAPLIGCTGFLMPHKGAQALIRATAALRATWPEIRLRLVMAQYPSRKSEIELRDCVALARKLGFAAHIEWHTAFLAPHQSAQLLAECDLLVLPYGKTPEASSASARMALASGAPTLVSPQPIFDDLRDAVGRVNHTVPGGLERQIEDWLRARSRRARLQQQAMAWQEEHDWARVGNMMVEVVETLVPAPIFPNSELRM